MIDVIYLAAGQGKRAKLGYPKQFARLGGKPIMVHALEVFQSMSEIRRIIIACADIVKTESVLNPYGIKKARCVQGGKTRQESVQKALEHVKTENVLIHEAVRPFITEEFVKEIIAVNRQAVTPWKPAISTVISIDGKCHDRSRFGEVQMPQKYTSTLLECAYEKAESYIIQSSTDDADLLNKAMLVNPYVIPGLEENIKITTPLDLVIAEAIYQARFRNGE